MKRFIWLVLLVAAGYGVWKYYPEIERMARERTTGGATAPVAEDALVIPGSGVPNPPARPTAAPAVATAGAPKADDDIELRYPLPAFKPIEVLTGDWKRIPASAFPREVTLRAPAMLQLVGGTGSARLDTGAKAMAVSAEEGRLTITPALGAAIRGAVDIDQTDFKIVLGAIYEQFKDRKRAEVAKLRQQARDEAKQSGPALSSVLASRGAEPPAEARAKIGPRPEQKPDRTVPVMLASIAERNAKKQSSEPKLADIHAWGMVVYREVNGEPFWGGSVRYTARTIFGEFPTEAVALMRQGKVVRWVYSGTGEPVP